MPNQKIANQEKVPTVKHTHEDANREDANREDANRDHADLDDAGLEDYRLEKCPPWSTHS